MNEQQKVINKSHQRPKRRKPCFFVGEHVNSEPWTIIIYFIILSFPLTHTQQHGDRKSRPKIIHLDSGSRRVDGETKSRPNRQTIGQVNEQTERVLDSYKTIAIKFQMKFTCTHAFALIVCNVMPCAVCHAYDQNAQRQQQNRKKLSPTITK